MKINKIKFLGAMFFITLLMDVVPSFGFIRIGAISITNMHIPVILTSIVLGPLEGMLVGALFGIISLARAVSRQSTVLDMLLQNPLISVLPRLCLPLVSGYFYRLISKVLPRKNYEFIRLTATSIVGASTNCLMVMGALYLVNSQELMDIFALSHVSQLPTALLKALGPNMAVESLFCALACILVMSALKKYCAGQESSHCV